jgi:hypothetical protein
MTEESGTAATKPDVRVRVGQIWQDNDKRSRGRKLLVVKIGKKYATVELVDARTWPNRSASLRDDDPRRAQPGRRTYIRLDRFRPTSTGYRLVEDAPTQEGQTNG